MKDKPKNPLPIDWENETLLGETTHNEMHNYLLEELLKAVEKPKDEKPKKNK